MRIRRKLKQADYDFSALRGRDRHLLLAAWSYELARESLVIRRALDLLARQDVSAQSLLESIGERGSAFEVNHAKPMTEVEIARVRVWDVIEGVCGVGSVWLRDLANEICADVPWMEIAENRRNFALARAKRSPQDLRDDGGATTISPDFGIQIASPAEVASAATTTNARPLAANGREVIAFRIAWHGFSNDEISERFRVLLGQLRPSNFASSNRREGRKASTVWRWLDDLGVMRALSVMPTKKLFEYRNSVGLAQRSNAQHGNAWESARVDLEKAHRAAIERFHECVTFDRDPPLRSARFKAD